MNIARTDYQNAKSIVTIRTLVFWSILFLLPSVLGIAATIKLLPINSISIERVIAAAGEYRPTEAKFVGNFPYAKYSPNIPRPNTIQELQFPDEPHTNPDICKVVSTLSIFKGQCKEAISHLEEVTEKWPSNVHLLNNLAIAYFISGNNEKNAFDWIKALETIKEAIETNKSEEPLLEIYFNYALISQKLFLSEEADIAWGIHLSVKSRNTINEWLLEVEQLKQETRKLENRKKEVLKTFEELKNDISNQNSDIVKQIVALNPQYARTYVIKTLLPEMAANNSNNLYSKDEVTQNKIMHYLWFAYEIGVQLKSLQNDAFTYDLISPLIQDWQNSHAHRYVNKFLFTYNNYLESLKKINRVNAISNDKLVNTIINNIKNLETVFQSLDNHAASNLISIKIAQLETPNDTALTRFENVLLIAKQRDYTHLQIDAYNGIGIIKRRYPTDIKKRNPLYIKEALTAYNQALKCAEELGDIQYTQIIYISVMDFLITIGETEQNWKYLYRLLTQSADTLSNKISILIIINKQLKQTNRKKMALIFANEAINLAKKSPDKWTLCLAFLYHSLTNHSIGNKEAALGDLDTTKTLIESVVDIRDKKRFDIYTKIIESEYTLLDNPQGAIDKLTDAITFYTNQNDRYNSTYIYKLRAQAHLLLGDIHKAKEDLWSGIKVYESERKNTDDQTLRIALFEGAQSIYDDMAALILRNGEGESEIKEAFNYIERSNGRTLYEMQQKSQNLALLDEKETEASSAQDSDTGPAVKDQPYTIEEIQQKLPPHTAIVQYSILKQTAPGQDLNKEYLYAFIIEQNSIKLVKTPYPITRKELEKLSLDYIQTLQNYNGDIQNLLRASQPIYDTVIKPIKSSLPPTTSTIVIIPDEAMYSLPLELLVEPDTRRYLTESGWKNLVTEYAPSATVFLQSLIHDEKLANKEDNRTTFVGDPEFNQATFGRLPALPAAKEEVIKSTQLYENNYLEHELLLGSRATKEKLLKATETTHILHFSGHAEESLSSPLNSKLILAGEDQLYAWEIYQQHFPKTRLVILAACSTAQGKAKAGEGLLSLGRAFLAAGVPAVVASRWKVADSPAAVEFFTTFHKHLIVGKNAVQALHQAQRHMLNHSNVEFHHPAYWGAFMVMGGSATMDTN